MRLRTGLVVVSLGVLFAGGVTLLVSHYLFGGASKKSGNFADQRKAMIESQLVSRGIKSPPVLHAMEKVPRHLFVPEKQRSLSYEDKPIPLGLDQSIPQAYLVAFMTELAQLRSTDRVLEIGTGSGYQAAVLGEICESVYTIEIVADTGNEAKARLKELGYNNVSVKIGDGYQGWEEHAPFDAILVTAAPDHLPPPLLKQLKLGGRMIVPLGKSSQMLQRITKRVDGLKKESLLPVMFDPMIGEAKKKPWL